jgi:hypothetical protein
MSVHYLINDKDEILSKKKKKRINDYHFVSWTPIWTLPLLKIKQSWNYFDLSRINHHRNNLQKL